MAADLSREEMAIAELPEKQKQRDLAAKNLILTPSAVWLLSVAVEPKTIEKCSF